MCGKKTILLATVILSLFLVPVAHGDYWAWPTEAVFKLDTHDTYVGFNKTAYFDSFIWDARPSTNVTFTNLNTGLSFPAIASLTVEAQNCNVTFDRVSEDKVTTLNITALATNVTTARFTGFGSRPEYVTIDGAYDLNNTYWQFSDSGVLTFAATFAADASRAVAFNWNPIPGGVTPPTNETVVPGGGSTYNPPSGNNVNPVLPWLPVAIIPTTPQNLMWVGISLIIGIVVFASIEGSSRRKRGLKASGESWSIARNKPLKAKWKRAVWTVKRLWKRKKAWED